MHLGGPLPSGRITPSRAAKLAARRSRPARKAGVSAHSGDGRFSNPIPAVKDKRQLQTSLLLGVERRRIEQPFQCSALPFMTYYGLSARAQAPLPRCWSRSN